MKLAKNVFLDLKNSVVESESLLVDVLMNNAQFVLETLKFYAPSVILECLCKETKYSFCLIQTYIRLLFFIPTPLEGGEELYTRMVFFLFRQLWPIDILIVEGCEWYH